MFKRVTSVLALLCLLVAVFVPATNVIAAADNFSIVVLPDTQAYAALAPSMFYQQAQWIQNTTSALNTVFVISLGDIVNDPTSVSQYAVAKSAYSMFTIDRSMLAGNWDGLTLYRESFPVSRLTKLVSSYPSGQPDCGYYRFSAGGLNLGILSISYQYKDDALAATWANAQLAAYPTDRVIFATHSFTGRLYAMNEANLWNNIVKTNSNIFMAVCGHDHTVKPILSMELTADDGHKIKSLLSAYALTPTSTADVTTGLIRYYRFFPSRNTIEAYDVAVGLQSTGTPTQTTSFSWYYLMS